MMKKVSRAALCAVLIGAPSLAAAQTYGGISGGVTLPENSENSGQTTTAIPASPTFPAIPQGASVEWTTEFDEGYNISAYLGHRFEGGFRIEGEFSYSESDISTHRGVTVGGTNIDAIDASILTRGAAVGSTVGAVVDSGIGRQRNYGAFANAYYDFNPEGAFMPYVGGGIGVQNVRFDYRPSNIDVGQGSDTNFAWQLMAGATYRISPAFELFGQYNYRDSGSTDIPLDLLPANLRAESRQSILSLGLRIPFGGRP
jgi:opacity protein-like surface antigen